ncbi:hypothetical protein LIA77_01152 [Sarocladium implicatum]|nr:hypothetical protein LIA77_01152 [Sarocladium implicatum]
MFKRADRTSWTRMRGFWVYECQLEGTPVLCQSPGDTASAFEMPFRELHPMPGSAEGRSRYSTCGSRPRFQVHPTCGKSPGSLLPLGSVVSPWLKYRYFIIAPAVSVRAIGSYPSRLFICNT